MGCVAQILCYTLHMSKIQKPGSAGSRNDVRSNGKASKKSPGRKSRLEKLDMSTLIMLNKGVYQQVSNRANAEKLRAKSADRKSSPNM